MYIFSTTTTRQSERLQTQLWVEGGVDDEMGEKICLSSEERLFQESQATSGAYERRKWHVHR
jgi:hypothetical protein